MDTAPSKRPKERGMSPSKQIFPVKKEDRPSNNNTTKIILKNCYFCDFLTIQTARREGRRVWELGNPGVESLEASALHWIAFYRVETT